jgi:hypothetical protein
VWIAITEALELKMDERDAIIGAMELETKEIDDPFGCGGNRSISRDESCITVRHRKDIVPMFALMAMLMIAVLAMSPIKIEGRIASVEEADSIFEEEVARDTPRNMAEIPPLPLDRDQLQLDEKTKNKLIEKWGQWHFWDGDKDMRPKTDYCATYPNRDIPGDDFPDEAWQVDAVYVNHFLNEAEKLISRAMEAIFTEYGKGKPLPPEKLEERLKMFHWEMYDLSKNEVPPPEFGRSGKREIGGWTTQRSFDGLVRRLLHAMVTEDTFTVVLAGHSAAKGEGYASYLRGICTGYVILPALLAL